MPPLVQEQILALRRFEGPGICPIRVSLKMVDRLLVGTYQKGEGTKRDCRGVDANGACSEHRTISSASTSASSSLSLISAGTREDP